MKYLALMLCAFALAGCVVNIPIGEGGKYGEAFVGYRPPANLPQIEAPLFRDK